jgi:hypothetical protein
MGVMADESKEARILTLTHPKKNSMLQNDETDH